MPIPPRPTENAERNVYKLHNRASGRADGRGRSARGPRPAAGVINGGGGGVEGAQTLTTSPDRAGGGVFAAPGQESPPPTPARLSAVITPGNALQRRPERSAAAGSPLRAMCCAPIAEKSPPSGPSPGRSFAPLGEKRARRSGSSRRLALTRHAKVRPARASLQEAALQQHGCRSEREDEWRSGCARARSAACATRPLPWFHRAFTGRRAAAGGGGGCCCCCRRYCRRVRDLPLANSSHTKAWLYHTSGLDYPGWRHRKRAFSLISLVRQRASQCHTPIHPKAPCCMATATNKAVSPEGTREEC